MPYRWNMCKTRVDALSYRKISLEWMLLAPVS
jgi:hypothetical protein